MKQEKSKSLKRKEIKYKYILLAFAVLLLFNFIDIGIHGQMKIVFSIVLFAAVLWFTEAMPLHISGLFAVLLLSILGGFKPEFLFTPFFDPIVVLLLGGF